MWLHSVGVRQKPPGSPPSVPAWMLAAAIGAVAVERRRRRRTAPHGRSSPDMDPEPAGLLPARAGCHHRQRRVVAMDLVGAQHVGGNRVDQRPQRERRLAGPASVERPSPTPAPGEGSPPGDRAAGGRRTCSPAGDEQPGARPAAVGRQVRRRRLVHRLAAAAGQLALTRRITFEAPRHILRDLAAVLAQPPEPAAARTACRRDCTLVARQMPGKRQQDRPQPPCRPPQRIAKLR